MQTRGKKSTMREMLPGQEKSIFIIGVVAVALILGVVLYVALIDDLSSLFPPVAAPGGERAPVPNPIIGIPVAPSGETIPPGSMGGTPPASGWHTYRSARNGFSIRYPTSYFISGTIEAPDGTFVRLNKTADRAKVDDLVLDRTAHLQFVALSNTVGLSLQGLAQRWGESQAGSRFRTADSCRSKTIAGESGLYCSFYASVENGGYRKSAFVSHAGRAYRFDVSSATNNDPIQRDFDSILSTLGWTN